MTELRVGGGKYQIERKLGSGSFGDIYLAVSLLDGEQVAVKLEQASAKHPQLYFESKLYKVLAGGSGIPLVKWYGTEGSYNIMVMDLLGPSLEDRFNSCQRKFSLKTVLMLVDQLIPLLEYLHERCFIHRDIKPDNFLMGLPSQKSAQQVFMIDLGLAKKYRDTKTGKHIAYREDKSLTGTARYASINAHLGIEQARRDDMESLGYMLLYFLRGSLPWQGLAAQTKRQKYEKIMEKKMKTSVDFLCFGFPPEFATYITYTRQLRFEEQPDYTYCRQLFHTAFLRERFVRDFVFDWDGAPAAVAPLPALPPPAPAVPGPILSQPLPALAGLSHHPTLAAGAALAAHSASHIPHTQHQLPPAPHHSHPHPLHHAHSQHPLPQHPPGPFAVGAATITLEARALPLGRMRIPSAARAAPAGPDVKRERLVPPSASTQVRRGLRARSGLFGEK